MNITTRAGLWMLDRSHWDEGMRGFFVRINATGSPDDMKRHISTIEKEVIENDAAALRKLLPGLDALLVLDAPSAGRIISTRPDVWDILRAYLGRGDR